MLSCFGDTRKWRTLITIRSWFRFQAAFKPPNIQYNLAPFSSSGTSSRQWRQPHTCHGEKWVSLRPFPLPRPRCSHPPCASASSFFSGVKLLGGAWSDVLQFALDFRCRSYTKEWSRFRRWSWRPSWMAGSSFGEWSPSRCLDQK
jgi:hypothetical protein